MSKTPAPETIFTDSSRVACDGDQGPLGHPRVWLQIDDTGMAECSYCDRRFILRGGAADKGAIPA